MNDMRTGDRHSLVVVCGLDFDTTRRTAATLLAPTTVVVEYDLSALALGHIRRVVRTVDADGLPSVRYTDVALEHGCVSCALRLDLLPLLPLLRSMRTWSGVERIVLALHPMIEPEPLSWAITNTMVVGVPGRVDAPAGRDVRLDAVIACLDMRRWLSDATGDQTLSEAGISEIDDERTLAQVVVGHVEFADALVLTGVADTAQESQAWESRGWEMARTCAVLRRVAPLAPVLYERADRTLTAGRIAQLLAAIPDGSRRGRVFGAHDPLLSGQPPLDDDCGVQIVEFSADRPFHPERLHTAIDSLLDGVVCARGRLWVATRPDEALWLESAGEALRIADGGDWLAAMTPAERDEVAAVDPERVAMASLRWDPVHGDRHTALVAVAHRADPAHIQDELRAACLTDAGYAAGPALWNTWSDPFGHEHVDPCVDSQQERDGTAPATHEPTTRKDAP